jgi:hypothetical protein
VIKLRPRLVVLIASTILTSVGVFVAACTDQTTTPLPGQGGNGNARKDGGSSSGNSSSGGDDDDDTDDPTDKDGGKEGGSAECKDAPFLHDNSRGGFFCAFLDARDAGLDAGGTKNCSDDEVCCNPAKVGNTFPKTFCAAVPRDDKGEANSSACEAQAEAAGSTWTTGKGNTWECGDKNACGDGNVCCLYTLSGLAEDKKVNVGKHQKLPATCNALQAFNAGGTKCATSCATDGTEIQTCSKSDECSGGKTCLPFAVPPGTLELGYCK